MMVKERSDAMEDTHVNKNFKTSQFKMMILYDKSEYKLVDFISSEDRFF